MFVHFFDGQMKNFPQVHFSEIVVHFFGEDPCGHGRTFNNLRFKQLVNQNAQHLLVITPQLVQIVQQTNLCLFRISDRLFN